MTAAGPQREPLPGPGVSMGTPESGTQHATTPDVSLPPPRPTGPGRPTQPIDDVVDDVVDVVEPPRSAAGNALGVLRDVADRRPELFLAGALVAGVVTARVLSRGSDDDE